MLLIPVFGRHRQWISFKFEANQIYIVSLGQLGLCVETLPNNQKTKLGDNNDSDNDSKITLR